MSLPSILSETEPKDVLHFFEEICAIPHGSYHTEKIADYLVAFANERKLKVIRDKANNVVIFKEASKGAENAAPVMLQGHTDMVLEKRSDVAIDMEKEPITLLSDGEFLYADGTTLGGDDGAAVAMMLAALDDDALVHPALECVFTSDEEVGLLGMEALDASPLRAKKMLNLDSEDEGILTAGCAGGAEVHLSLPVKRKNRYGAGLSIQISGLKGGHSGSSIQEGVANADILMARLLTKIYKKVEFSLVSFEGGSKDNAIPREATADILIGDRIDRKTVENTIQKFSDQIGAEYRVADAEIRVDYHWKEDNMSAASSVSRKETGKILRFILALPNGVVEMDPNQRTLPQTSLNMGIVKLEEEKLQVVTLLRSSINSQKKYLKDKVRAVADLADAKMEVVSTYPAWEYTAISPFRDLVAELYQKETGKEAQIAVIHGGLECGLMAGKIKGLECVSLGPDMSGIHTPDEKLSVASLRRTWDFVKAILKECTKE